MFDQFVRHHARQRPYATAVSSLRGDVSYARFDADIDRMAAALLAAGAGQARLAAVRQADVYVHWLAVTALARLGVASSSFGPMQAAGMAQLIGADFVVTDAAPGADPVAPGGAVVGADAGWVRDALGRPADPVPSRRVDPAALGRVSTSSGTTGVPKKIGQSWRALMDAIARHTAETGAQGQLNRTMPVIGPEAGGLFTPHAAWALGGAALIGPADPVELAAALPRLAPSGLFLAPVQLRMLLDALPDAFTPMPGLFVGTAGGHTPRELQIATRMKLTPNLQIIYGSTEAGLVAQGHAAMLNDDQTSMGWLCPQVEAEIVDETGRVLSAGGQGQLRVRTPSMATGYLDDPEATAVSFREGWFYPGDIASLSEEGLLRVFGRSDDLMNFGGEKFMPLTIEAPVLALGGVIDAAAFAREDEKGLPTPWIAVVKGEGFDDKALARALAIPALPPVHVVWTDRIPRNATGKPQRDILRAAAGKARPQGAA